MKEMPPAEHGVDLMKVKYPGPLPSRSAHFVAFFCILLLYARSVLYRMRAFVTYLQNRSIDDGDVWRGLWFAPHLSSGCCRTTTQLSLAYIGIASFLVFNMRPLCCGVDVSNVIVCIAVAR